MLFWNLCNYRAGDALKQARAFDGRRQTDCGTKSDPGSVVPERDRLVREPSRFAKLTGSTSPQRRTRFPFTALPPPPSKPPRDNLLRDTPARPPVDEAIDAARSTLRAGATLDETQARALLSAAVYQFRTIRPDLSAAKVKGWCGPARDLAVEWLKDQGLQASCIRRYNSARLFGGDAHAFAVVSFAGAGEFIVDPTFQQFVSERADRGARARRLTRYLARHQAANQMANQLIRDGFIALTQASAKHYGQALCAQGGVHHRVRIENLRKRDQGSLFDRDDLSNRLRSKLARRDGMTDEQAAQCLARLSWLRNKPSMRDTKLAVHPQN